MNLWIYKSLNMKWLSMALGGDSNSMIFENQKLNKSEFN